MSESLEDAALSAIAAKLRAEFPGVPIALDKRDDQALGDGSPRLSLSLTLPDVQPDTEFAPFDTLYTLTVDIVGHVRPDAADKAATAALLASAGDTFTSAPDHAAGRLMRRSAADLVRVLAAWRPAAAWASEILEGGREFRLYGAEESAAAAGEFTARFILTATRPTGAPFV